MFEYRRSQRDAHLRRSLISRSYLVVFMKLRPPKTAQNVREYYWHRPNLNFTPGQLYYLGYNPSALFHATASIQLTHQQNKLESETFFGYPTTPTAHKTPRGPLRPLSVSDWSHLPAFSINSPRLGTESAVQVSPSWGQQSLTHLRSHIFWLTTTQRCRRLPNHT